ncbi:hypothetical protein H8959_004076, partial [Pygathrix nigripes]
MSKVESSSASCSSKSSSQSPLGIWKDTKLSSISNLDDVTVEVSPLSVTGITNGLQHLLKPLQSSYGTVHKTLDPRK